MGVQENYFKENALVFSGTGSSRLEYCISKQYFVKQVSTRLFSLGFRYRIPEIPSRHGGHYLRFWANERRQTGGDGVVLVQLTNVIK